nr:MAG TPA: helix-turn-helix domain protein [Caudoviricetes sp.]
MTMIDFDTFLEKKLKNPDFKREYDALDKEFELIDELLKARSEAKMTQAQVAEAMGVKQSAVARIESGNLDMKYSTLVNYLNAVGKRIAIV